METITKPKAIKHTRKLAHTFTDEEREKMNTNLADQVLEIQKLEIEKKETASRFKREIDDLNTRNKRLAKWLHDGWEERDTAVEVINHYPEDGKRTVTRMDTLEQWVEDMNENTLDTLDGWNGEEE